MKTSGVGIILKPIIIVIVNASRTRRPFFRYWVGGLVGWRFACLGYTIERGRVTPQNGDCGLLGFWVVGLWGYWVDWSLDF